MLTLIFDCIEWFVNNYAVLHMCIMNYDVYNKYQGRPHNLQNILLLKATQIKPITAKHASPKLTFKVKFCSSLQQHEKENLLELFNCISDSNPLAKKILPSRL